MKTLFILSSLSLFKVTSLIGINGTTLDHLNLTLTNLFSFNFPYLDLVPHLMVHDYGSLIKVLLFICIFISISILSLDLRHLSKKILDAVVKAPGTGVATIDHGDKTHLGGGGNTSNKDKDKKGSTNKDDTSNKDNTSNLSNNTSSQSSLAKKGIIWKIYLIFGFIIYYFILKKVKKRFKKIIHLGTMHSFLFGIILHKLNLTEKVLSPSVASSDNSLLYEFSLAIFVLSLICLLSFINILGYFISMYLINKYDIKNKYPKYIKIIRYFENSSLIYIIFEIVLCFVILISLIICTLLIII